MSYKINLNLKEYHCVWSEHIQQKVRRDKNFILDIFQAIDNQKDKWVTPRYSRLIENAISILSPEDLQQNPVINVLNALTITFKNNQDVLDRLFTNCLWNNPNNTPLIGKLLQMGIRINLIPSQVFFHATQTCFPELLELLIAHGLNVNPKKKNNIAEKNKTGEPILFAACDNPNSAVAIFLIEHEADVNDKNNQQLSVLQYAALKTKNSQGIVKKLLEHGALVELNKQWSEILVTVYNNNHQQLVLELVKLEQKTSSKNLKNLEKLLHLACSFGDVALSVQLLDMQIPTSLVEGITPSGIAIMQGHENCAQLFPPDEITETVIRAIVVNNYLGLNTVLSLKSGETSSLAGIFTPYTCWTIADSLLTYQWKDSILLTNQQKEKLTNAFKEASVFRDLKTLSSSLSQDKLVILNCGWRRHAIALVFYKNYMIICNRQQNAPHTLYPFKIDRKKLMETCLEEIVLQTENNLPAYVSIPFYYHRLPQMLSPNSDGSIINVNNDPECQRMAQLMSPKYQKSGNCAIVAPVTAFRAAVVVLAANGQEISDSLCIRSRNEGKAFSLHGKLYHYQQFQQFRMKKIREGNYPVQNDEQLVRAFSQKVKKLSSKYNGSSLSNNAQLSRKRATESSVGSINQLLLPPKKRIKNSPYAKEGSE